MLFVTPDWGAEHEALIASMHLGGLRSRIHVRSARRDEVPALVGASDVMLSFIKPAYSKIASSPTKLAEALALGVPVISSAGIGDVDRITRELDAGAVFELSDDSVFETIAAALDEIRAKGGAGLRSRARERLGLELAHRAYRSVYEDVERLAEDDVRARAIGSSAS
jgi:glycosyltransferase involved in cell wall biosynthesis